MYVTITHQTITIQQEKMDALNRIFPKKLLFSGQIVYLSNKPIFSLVLCIFKHENQNSEHTFISSTLKDEETKESSE